MVSFPGENWIPIFQELERRDWLVLSRVCSLFRTIAQAALYDKIALAFYDDAGGTPEGDIATTLFIRSITERRELGNLVRSINLYYRGDSPIHMDVSTPILKLFASFPDLRHLGLHHVYIDDAIVYSVLRPLLHLVSMEFNSCPIDPAILPQSAQFSPRRASSEVAVEIPLSIDALAAIVPIGIGSLTIADEYSSPKLRVLFESMLRGPRPTLTTLIIYGTIPANLMLFLESCPQLRHISLPYGIRNVIPSLVSVPQDALTLLGSFTGDVGDVELFVSGRPVHTANVSMDHNTSSTSLLPLRFSTGPITNLVIDVYKIPPALLQYIPTTLHSLEVTGHSEASNIALHVALISSSVKSEDILWMSSLSRMPDLCVFKLPGIPLSFEKQVAMLDAATAACGSLREFTFAPERYSKPYNVRVLQKTGLWRRYPYLYKE